MLLHRLCSPAASQAPPLPYRTAATDRPHHDTDNNQRILANPTDSDAPPTPDNVLGLVHHIGMTVYSTWYE